MALDVSLADIPWSFVMAFASLALIYYLFRRRADVFADFAFSGKEVALLALGSIAGWAVNIPVAIRKLNEGATQYLDASRRRAASDAGEPIPLPRATGERRRR